MLSTEKIEKRGYESPVSRMYPLMVEQSFCSVITDPNGGVIVNPWDDNGNEDLGD